MADGAVRLQRHAADAVQSEYPMLLGRLSLCFTSPPATSGSQKRAALLTLLRASRRKLGTHFRITSSSIPAFVLRATSFK